MAEAFVDTVAEAFVDTVGEAIFDTVEVALCWLIVFKLSPGTLRDVLDDSNSYVTRSFSWLFRYNRDACISL